MAVKALSHSSSRLHCWKLLYSIATPSKPQHFAHLHLPTSRRNWDLDSTALITPFDASKRHLVSARAAKKKKRKRALCKERERRRERDAEVSPADRVEWVKCRVLFCRRSHLICRNYCHALFMRGPPPVSKAPRGAPTHLSLCFLSAFLHWRAAGGGSEGEGFRNRSADNKMIVFFRV